MSPVPPMSLTNFTERPHLKITGLRIRNLRPVARLDLPKDGIGWEGHFPDLCMIAGNNGSGKTTLLEFLYWAFHMLAIDNNLGLDILNRFPERWLGVDAEIDLLVTLPRCDPAQVKLLVKERFAGGFFSPDYAPQSITIYPRVSQSLASLMLKGTAAGVKSHGLLATELHELLEGGKVPSGVVYIPSGTRAVTAGSKDDKRAGPMPEPTDFAYKWQRPEQWNKSLESLLYGARWEDLNASQNGHPEEATHFATFVAAFERYFGKTKTLKWTNRGELFVEVADSKEQHGLDLLSAGEQQMLVLVGDLMHRWQPGSIILIDEPELHFHSAWQGYFWEFLRDMLRERGGQVLLASQSPELFSAAELGERLILGM